MLIPIIYTRRFFKTFIIVITVISDLGCPMEEHRRIIDLQLLVLEVAYIEQDAIQGSISLIMSCYAGCYNTKG